MILCVDGQHTEKENTLRRGNVQGADQPYLGELMMAVYRVSDYFPVDCGVNNRGHKRTVLHALFSCGHCGTFFRMAKSTEKAGRSKSCGCMKSVKCSEGMAGKKNSKRHGMYESRTYTSWAAMKSRCKNERNTKYYMYGARGIKVCERWECFESFLEDMGERPAGCSIDRIDSNGDYCPENCRWSNAKTQARNTRKNVFLTIDGKTMTISEWSECPGASPYATISARIKKGWGHEDSVFGRLKCRAS